MILLCFHDISPPSPPLLSLEKSQKKIDPQQSRLQNMLIEMQILEDTLIRCLAYL